MFEPRDATAPLLDRDHAQRLQLVGLLRFPDRAMEKAFWKRRWRSHTRLMSCVMAVAMSADVPIHEGEGLGVVVGMAGAWAAVALAVHLLTARGRMEAAYALCMGSVALMDVSVVEALHVDLMDTRSAALILYLQPMVALLLAAPAVHWMLAMPAFYCYAWARQPAHVEGDCETLFNTAWLLGLAAPGLWGVELAARRSFAAYARLEEANIKLEVEAAPFSLRSLRAWATGAPVPAREGLTTERALLTESARALRPWEIPFEELQLGVVVGAGASGRVHAARRRGEPVAVKLLFFMGDEDLASFATEVGTLAQLRHPNVVRLLGLSKSARDGVSHLYLVTELCPRVLSDELASPALPAPRALAAQIAAGCAYLHDKGVVHRDIKPHNVLLSSDWEAKICDFGLARSSGRLSAAGALDHLTANRGTYAFMAPELMHTTDTVAHADARKVDVYSYGIVLWCLLHRGMPYEHFATEIEIAIAVATAGERPEVDPAWDAELVGIMQRCWAEEPAERPLFGEVVGWLSSGRESFSLG